MGTSDQSSRSSRKKIKGDIERFLMRLLNSFLPIAFTVILLSQGSLLHADENTKLLCGFEPVEMRPKDSVTKYFIGKLWTKKGDPPVKWRFKKDENIQVNADYKGGVSLYRTGSSRDYHYMHFAYTEESQGKYALLKRFSGPANYMNNWGKFLPKPPVKLPVRRDPTQLRGIVMYNSFRNFSKYFPRDWSGFAYLLVDVKSVKAEMSFSILLEDDDCEPYLDRVYDVPGGKWYTLVFDLSDAKSKGLLDPTKMANIFIAVEKVKGATEVWADNIRLAKKEVKQKFPLLLDKNPWRESWLPAKAKKIISPTIDAKPDHSPIKLEDPVSIKLSSHFSRTRFSQLLNSISAFDNRYMVIGGALGGGKSALVSIDGGKTWKGQGESKKPIVLSSGHQSDRGVYVDDSCGLLGVTITTCAGGSKPSDIYFRNLKFTGKDWELRPYYLVDLDVRHCPFETHVARQANGRIWAVWDHLNRHGKAVLRIKASDDNGVTWNRTKGASHLEKIRVPLSGRALVPYGKNGMALLFLSTTKSGYHVYWSYSDDGESWSEATLVEKKGKINAMASLSSKEIFYSNTPGGRKSMLFADAKRIKVRTYDGKSWKEEVGPWKSHTGKFSSPNLGVINDQVYAVWCEINADSTYSIKLSLRLKDGKWTKPYEVAVEKMGVTNILVPRNSPPNFVPLAWATRDKTFVKVHRIPIEVLIAMQ